MLWETEVDAIPLGSLLVPNSLLVVASRINSHSTKNLHSPGKIYCSNLIYQMIFLEFNLVINYQEIFEVSKPNRDLFLNTTQGKENLQKCSVVSGIGKEREIKSNSLIFVK